MQRYRARVFYQAMTITMNLREIYRLDANGETLVRVSAEVPPAIPKVKLEERWLRGIIDRALQTLRARSAPSLGGP